jgi:hypothetical protein
MAIILLIVVAVLLLLLIGKGKSVTTKEIENFLVGKGKTKEIENLTNNWIDAVTKRNPAEVAKLFCSDANLVGTVSQIERRGPGIKKYFDYFANLPGITVKKKVYSISQVSKDVFVNTAFITWTWHGLDSPIVARMTFLFRNNCIFQLHSSALPKLNEELQRVSGAK